MGGAFSMGQVRGIPGSLGVSICSWKYLWDYVVVVSRFGTLPVGFGAICRMVSGSGHWKQAGVGWALIVVRMRVILGYFGVSLGSWLFQWNTVIIIMGFRPVPMGLSDIAHLGIRVCKFSPCADRPVMAVVR